MADKTARALASVCARQGERRARRESRDILKGAPRLNPPRQLERPRAGVAACRSGNRVIVSGSKRARARNTICRRILGNSKRQSYLEQRQALRGDIFMPITCMPFGKAA